jgi:uncharacterized membrane protein
VTDSERLARIEGKLDGLALRFDDFRVTVEQRTTKLEIKAALLGTAGGAVVGVILKFLVP